ncbi:MAG: SDR family oxidoreductase [Verrucomicrobia bacterium]|nr:SDR family oxidoreductase [Verrucomicrobiota bacterium]
MSVLDQFRLDGRVAVITGGSKGLGKSIAQAFAEAGATLVLASRHRDECQAALEDLRKLTGCDGLAIACDVTKESSVRKLFDAALKKFGRVDVLVNNAGTNIRHPIEEYPTAVFRTVLDTNLTGAWLCCRAVAPLFKKQRRGACINLGSAMSHVGLPERSAYCAAKAGILGLTRVMALEWAPFNARCNALCPGPFATEINAPLLKNPAKARVVVGSTALNRWAELREIRGAALFLASDASSYVTGASLSVDGGWTAR